MEWEQVPEGVRACCATLWMAGEEACHVREVHLGQGREMVRRRAALHAMDLLRRQLTGCPL